METNLRDRFIRLELDIRNIPIDHERDEVDDEIRILAQTRKGGITKRFESGVMRRRNASHRVDHFLADLDGWWERFGISSENVTEIDCRQRL